MTATTVGHTVGGLSGGVAGYAPLCGGWSGPPRSGSLFASTLRDVRLGYTLVRNGPARLSMRRWAIRCLSKRTWLRIG